MAWGRTLMIAGPAVLLAGLGITHPQDLTPDTAPWWTTLHVILLVLFPLLGVSLWLLLAGIPGLVAWVGRAAAFGYIAFYTALDVLAGIGTGTLVQRGLAPNSGPVGALFDAGNDLASIGTMSFLLACLATAAAFLLRVGPQALPGGAVLVAAAVPFLNSHIYWPTGVISMVGLAVGLGLLASAPSPRWSDVAFVREPGV